jgi:hypothetical protein
MALCAGGLLIGQTNARKRRMAASMVRWMSHAQAADQRKRTNIKRMR